MFAEERVELRDRVRQAFAPRDRWFPPENLAGLRDVRLPLPRIVMSFPSSACTTKFDTLVVEQVQDAAAL